MENESNKKRAGRPERRVLQTGPLVLKKAADRGRSWRSSSVTRRPG